MKAIIHTKYGPPDVLEVKEIEMPTPKNNEVLIKIHSTTFNRTDCGLIRAQPFVVRFITGLFKPKNQISGSDFAGVIETIGENVTKFNVGDRVFGLNDEGLSSHAQYMSYSQNDALAVIPENISFEQAAASIEGAHYAYNAINKVRLNIGDRVLVNGASGAIGSAAVQLLKYYGAVVTAVCNTKNLELIKSIGADKVIDYTTEDFTLSDEKFKIIVDAVGKSTFAKCRSLLEPGGAYISSELGPGSQNIFLALLTPILSSFPGGRKRKKVVFPFPMKRLRSVLLVRKLMEEGKFIPIIDRKYPLEEIAEAFRYVETGVKTGSVVIEML